MSEQVPGTVTVVVPTYNERANIGLLIKQLDDVLPLGRAEILVVDDSSDGTGDVVLAVAREVGVPVRLMHRPPHDRTGGLGGAVLRGLRSATGDWVVVMDGDLQHPPSKVPLILARAARGDVDVVVASRYVDGGSASGLADRWRKVISSGAGSAARVLFPGALRHCTDPMSGFFAVRRAALDTVELRPDGFKILLEILARAGRLRVAEVPFVFAERHAGESKASMRQGLVYLRHLLLLRVSGTPGRLAGFLLIGASGLIPNLGAMLLLERAGMHYLQATVLATWLAITWNFALSDTLLFRDRRFYGPGRRYASYLGLNSLDIVFRLPLMAVLVGSMLMPVLLATALSTAVVAAARFAVLDRVLYRRIAPKLTTDDVVPASRVGIHEAA